MSKQFKITYDKLLSLTNLQLKPYSDSKAELERSLDRTRALLKQLGSPDKKLKFIHITGTSGKGSTANMLHQILFEAGEKVGTYTSPHTTSYLERFQTGDKLIDPKILSDSIEEVISAYEQILEKGSDELSFFELSTAVALHAFVKAGIKWCVLEVGCGGRYDATNVIPTPRVAIITNIDLDHTELLGNTLSEIAYEKAGIIKNNGVVFSGETRPTIRKIFMKEAIKNNAALFFIDPHHDVGARRALPLQFGSHQQHNSAIAEAVARELEIPDEIVAKALQSTKLLPCRFETIQKNPTVILDGAHSPAKIKTTVAMIKNQNLKPHIIFGWTSTKNPEEIIKQLALVAESITTTRFDTQMRKAANPFKLLGLVPKSKRTSAFLDWRDALEHVEKLVKFGGARPGSAGKSDTIVITGSLYLSGDMRAHWIPEEQIIKNRSSFKK